MPKTRFLLLLFILLAAACGQAPVPPTSTPVPPTPIPTDTPLPTDTPTPTETFTPMETPAPTLGIGSSLVSPQDNLELVYVPAGPFLMGYNGGYADEGPEHTVTLSAFWIDKTEVTTAAYQQCVHSGSCGRPAKSTSNGIDQYFGSSIYAFYPVIFVSWNNAQAYCGWAGERLPTEAQWEKAARGTDGRLYPWGNNPPDKTLANFDDNVLDVTQVGSYPSGASPYGALDMAGNVWEWTFDWYSTTYYGQSAAKDPLGPETGTKKVLRGGSWNFDAPGARVTYRLAKDPTFVYADTGFRCVKPAP